jgi:sulfur carrier protein
VQLTINGKTADVPDGLTLAALVEHLGLRVGSVVVEHNGDALIRSELDRPACDGDVVELIKAVAGG